MVASSKKMANQFKFKFFVFSLLCSISLANALPSFAASDDPVVTVQQGQIRGILKSTPAGTLFNAFLGVPYAEPPVGDLRFKPPVVAESWNDVLDTVSDPPQCLQMTYGNITQLLSHVGEEDCLYLNVYSPNLSAGANLPVHVFVYGGAFTGGHITSSDYGPEKYMDKGIVLMLMNYRIGPLGFLSTYDDAATGNYGLLDQNAALVWVRDNIVAFGGNPNDVTLSGQSAGSASVMFQYLSPMSAGLFHRVIAESGSAINPWALEEHPLQIALELGKQFNCSQDDTHELVDCLREQDGGELVEKQLVPMIENLQLAFVPSVENPDSGLFLTEDPTTLLQEGRFNQVPLIMGFNRDEGVLIYEYIFILMEDINDAFFDDVVPLLLTVLTDYRTNLLNVSYAIKDEYYSKIDLQNHTQVVRTNIDFISDMFMKSWIVQSVEYISSHDVPVYLYDFEYVSNSSSSNFTGEPDVVHGTELKFLFNRTTNEVADEDQPFGEQFLELWTNFIWQGNPAPSGSVIWLPTPAGSTLYLEIDQQFTLIDGYNPERMTFWNEVVPSIVNA